MSSYVCIQRLGSVEGRAMFCWIRHSQHLNTEACSQYWWVMVHSLCTTTTSSSPAFGLLMSLSASTTQLIDRRRKLGGATLLPPPVDTLCHQQPSTVAVLRVVRQQHHIIALIIQKDITSEYFHILHQRSRLCNNYESSWKLRLIGALLPTELFFQLFLF